MEGQLPVASTRHQLSIANGLAALDRVIVQIDRMGSAASGACA